MERLRTFGVVAASTGSVAAVLLIYFWQRQRNKERWLKSGPADNEEEPLVPDVSHLQQEPPKPSAPVPPPKPRKPYFDSEKPSAVPEKPIAVSEKPPTEPEKPFAVSEKPPTVSEKPPSVSEKPPAVSETLQSETGVARFYVRCCWDEAVLEVDLPCLPGSSSALVADLRREVAARRQVDPTRLQLRQDCAHSLRGRPVVSLGTRHGGLFADAGGQLSPPNAVTGKHRLTLLDEGPPLMSVAERRAAVMAFLLGEETPKEAS